MQVEHPTVGLGSWRRWMMANFVGFTIGGAIFGAVQRARMQPYFEVVTSGADAARILAANTGVSMTMFGALVGGRSGWRCAAGSGLVGGYRQPAWAGP
jgi:hypothetical protein